MTQTVKPEDVNRFITALLWVEQQMAQGTTTINRPLPQIPFQHARFRLITDIDPADDISDQVRAYLSADDIKQIETDETVKGVGIAKRLLRISSGSLTTGETIKVIDLTGNYAGGAATSDTDAAEGWAIHPHDYDWWEIMELEQEGGSGVKVGELDGTLSQGSSATVNILDKTWDETGETEEAWDALLPVAGELASGTRVFITKIAAHDRWYVTAAECE
jgi:hypothetical protein